jgi:hypothetical protein
LETARIAIFTQFAANLVRKTILPHGSTRRAPKAVLEGLNQHIEPVAEPKCQTDTAKLFEPVQLSAKLGRGHGASLLFRLFAIKLYRRPHGRSNQAFPCLKSVAGFGKTQNLRNV